MLQIDRVQNKDLHTKYVAHKAEVTHVLAGTGIPAERRLWHGTDLHSMVNICKTGFHIDEEDSKAGKLLLILSFSTKPFSVFSWHLLEYTGYYQRHYYCHLLS